MPLTGRIRTNHVVIILPVSPPYNMVSFAPLREPCLSLESNCSDLFRIGQVLHCSTTYNSYSPCVPSPWPVCSPSASNIGSNRVIDLIDKVVHFYLCGHELCKAIGWISLFSHIDWNLIEIDDPLCRYANFYNCHLDVNYPFSLSRSRQNNWFREAPLPTGGKSAPEEGRYKRK